MNELYVCEADLPKQKERRRAFEKSMLFASVLAALLLIVVLGMLLLSGRFEIWSIISAFIIAAFVLVLPIFRYTPAVEADTLPAVPPIALPQKLPEAPAPTEARPKRKKLKSR